MISFRKQRHLVITNLIFDNSRNMGSFEVVNLKTNDVIQGELYKRKNEKEYKQKIKELWNFANSLDSFCYEPITVRIDKDGEIFSGSIVMRDYSDNLDEIEEAAKERGLI